MKKIILFIISCLILFSCEEVSKKKSIKVEIKLSTNLWNLKVENVLISKFGNRYKNHNNLLLFNNIIKKRGFRAYLIDNLNITNYYNQDTLVIKEIIETKNVDINEYRYDYWAYIYDCKLNNKLISNRLIRYNSLLDSLEVIILEKKFVDTISVPNQNYLFLGSEYFEEVGAEIYTNIYYSNDSINFDILSIYLGIDNMVEDTAFWWDAKPSKKYGGNAPTPKQLYCCGKQS